MRIYCSGTFDLFHYGHCKLFENIKIKYPGSYLMVGVASDNDTVKFKGSPVMNYNERVEILRHIKYIDEIIPNIEVLITNTFLDKYKIDLVIGDGSPYAVLDPYYICKELGKFEDCNYTIGISSSNIIQRILNNKLSYQLRNEKKGFYELHSSVTGDLLVNLKKAQKKMTGILREFDRICRKYDIKYWCIGGTLIGAARHSGWIPWDGDTDVGMLESDYSVFIEHKSELPKNMFLQDPNTDNLYTSPQFCEKMVKIRDINSHYIMPNKSKHHDGLQLDIFIHKINNNIISPGVRKPTGDLHDYKYSDIFPLEQIMFEDIKVYVAHDYKNICKNTWNSFPPPVPPVSMRRPHEGNGGNINPDSAHPTDIKNYSNLYINPI